MDGLFTTGNVGLISAFRLYGITPKETRYDNRRITCRFEETPELARVRDEFYSGALVGSLGAYNSIVRTIFAEIREAREVSNGSR
jgi:hypothetical protein